MIDFGFLRAVAIAGFWAYLLAILLRAAPHIIVAVETLP